MKTIVVNTRFNSYDGQPADAIRAQRVRLTVGKQTISISFEDGAFEIMGSDRFEICPNISNVILVRCVSPLEQARKRK